MENSLQSTGSGVAEIIVMTHFMPVNDRHEMNELVELFQRYGVGTVVYGHLHGAAPARCSRRDQPHRPQVGDRFSPGKC